MRKKLELVILEPFVKESEKPFLVNITCIDADKEYSINIKECRQFCVKARGGIIKLAFNILHSNLHYIQIADGLNYKESYLHTKNFILYFQSPTAGCIVEILYWL